MNAEQIEAATKTVCEGILEGLPARFACINALISQKMYHVWRMRGEGILEKSNDGQDVLHALYQAYMDFFVQTERAHGEYLHTLTKRMLENDPNSDNVAAISWELEQRYPKEYGEDKGKNEGKNLLSEPDDEEPLLRRNLLMKSVLSEPDDDCDS